MTLILTSLRSDTVVQVSDVRLKRDQELEDVARKMIFLQPGDGRWVVSYTGLAELVEGGEQSSIEDWLVSVVKALPPVDSPHIVVALAERLSKAVASTKIALRLPQEKERLTVLLAGIDVQTSRPKVISFSNFETLGHFVWGDPKRGIVVRPAEVPRAIRRQDGDFETVVSEYSGDGVVLVNGRYDVIHQGELVALWRWVRRAADHGASARTIGDLMVHALQATANRDPQGDISSDCWSSITTSELTEFKAHFGEERAYQVQPQVVWPGHQVQLWVSGGEDSLVREVSDQLAQGDLDIPFTTEGYIAFFRWSPTVRRLNEIVSHHDVQLMTQPTLVERGLLVLRIARLNRIVDLERFLTTNLDWLLPFLDAHLTNLVEERERVALDSDIATLWSVVAGHRHLSARFGTEANWSEAQELIDLADQFRK